LICYALQGSYGPYEYGLFTRSSQRICTTHVS